MDASLKKRLIGAAILVLLAAIILPMFLSSPAPRQDGTTTVPVQVPPAPDRDLSQITVPIGDAADPDPIVAVDVGAESPRPSPPEQDPEPEPSAPAPTEPPPAAAAPPSAPAERPRPAASSQAPPIATAASGRYWVGLGSYGQPANAERVVSAAAGRGIEVSRETVAGDGRELTRLRAGPYATRAQAEQARQLLLAAVPDAEPKVEEGGAQVSADAPAAAAGATPRAGAWAVQVGAFGQQTNAVQLSDRLKRAGYPAFVERRGESWAVRVGPYVRRTEAEAQRQRLKSGQQLDGLIVAHSG